jgi:hypothetical protein
VKFKLEAKGVTLPATEGQCESLTIEFDIEPELVMEWCKVAPTLVPMIVNGKLEIVAALAKLGVFKKP